METGFTADCFSPGISSPAWQDGQVARQDVESLLKRPTHPKRMVLQGKGRKTNLKIGS
jgi:hypothetical protein